MLLYFYMKARLMSLNKFNPYVTFSPLIRVCLAIILMRNLVPLYKISL